MNYEAAIAALIVLTTQIVSMVLKDEALTDEQKKEFISRITEAQDSIPEWK